MRRVDLAIVGGGIVGLAVARAVVDASPRLRVAVVEKESRLAAHQSGRNSGVIHSGIYYPPASLKARLVLSSRQPLIDLCERHDVPIAFRGKVIVAAVSTELQPLRLLFDRGRSNGLAVEWLDADGLRRVEPHARGVAAVRVPEAGCTDYGAVARALGAELASAGVDVHLGTAVQTIHESPGSVALETDGGSLTAGRVVVCAGLHASQFGSGNPTRAELMIVPFRGEYFELDAANAELVNSMIYPVPDPRLPFLGVHLTRGIDGQVHVGPNAVPAMAREGYTRASVDPHYLRQLTAFPGSRGLARRYWRTGATEIWRSLNRRAFVRDVQRLLPGVTVDMLRPAAAGVRAQAVTRDGRLLDDFAFRRGDRVVYVDNAPSPAATAALGIGRHVAAML